MRGFGEAVYEYIRANVPEEDILTEEPMSRHTTFRIGGEALSGSAVRNSYGS